MDQFSEAITFQRYRLMLISTWPESETKQAAARSARSALEREIEFSAGLLRDKAIVGTLPGTLRDQSAEVQ